MRVFNLRITILHVRRKYLNVLNISYFFNTKSISVLFLQTVDTNLWTTFLRSVRRYQCKKQRLRKRKTLEISQTSTRHNKENSRTQKVIKGVILTVSSTLWALFYEKRCS